MPVINENVLAGLRADAPFQVGRSNIDNNTRFIERDIGFPWPSDPAASYLYYDCAIATILDNGMVVHNRLPQIDNTPDTLASCALDDPRLDTIVGLGVNLKCADQYADIVQRMGHARYWFRLWGQALRIGYQIPIPGLKYIGGVPAIPYHRNPEWALNAICPGGNFGGVILWRAAWSLWYTTAIPPVSQTIPAADASAHISGVVIPPATIQVPYSQADDNALPAGPRKDPEAFGRVIGPKVGGQ